MYELKTKVNDANVQAFIDSIENKKRQKDSITLIEIIGRLSKEAPVMWGDSIIGFGKYHYEYASGHSGDSMRLGFSPRKTSLSIYIMGELDKYQELLNRLGKHKRGKGCLYINKLEDVDMDVLEELISKSLENMMEDYPQ